MGAGKRSKLLFLLLLVLIPSAFALEIPEPTGFVNDHVGLLEPYERTALEQQLQTIEKNGTVEIALLIIPSLEGEELEMFSTEVFREWGVGKEDVDNGILIVIVRDSRQIRIEVGYGLEGVVTDATSGLIIRNRIVPAFQQDRYYEGLSLAAEDIALLAASDPDTVSAYQTASKGSNGWMFVLVLMIIYFAGLLFISRHYKDKKKKQKAKSTLSSVVLVLAWISSYFVTSALLWFVIFIVLMINITTSGHAGFFFMPGFRGGGGGGFGGFGGGMSGGGGSSGGW